MLSWSEDHVASGPFKVNADDVEIVPDLEDRKNVAVARDLFANTGVISLTLTAVDPQVTLKISSSSVDVYKTIRKRVGPRPSTEPWGQ